MVNMRHDMDRVIVERPRKGASDSAKRQIRRRCKIDPEAHVPGGMQRMHMRGHETYKELNENLKPLYRYLNKQVGRKWNDVYSELSQELNRNSAVQLHVFQHIFDIVEVKVCIIDGVVFDSAGQYELTNFRSNVRMMYVDPQSGCLKFLPNKKRHQYPKRDNSLIQYRLVNDVWYEVKFKQMEYPRYNNDYYCYDILTKEYFSSIRMYGRYDGKLPVEKRQLNSKEIKKLDLWNKNQTK